MKNSLKSRRFWIVLIAFGTTCVGGFSRPADAQIVCQNGNQLVAGNWLSTPFCEDQRVAEVAAEYGMIVSPHLVRNNPNAKKDVCRLIGQDIRVNMTCGTVLPELRGHVP